MCAVWTERLVVHRDWQFLDETEADRSGRDGRWAGRRIHGGTVQVALGLIALTALLQSRVPQKTVQICVGLLFVLAAFFVFTR